MNEEDCEIVVVHVLDKYEENIDAIAKQHGFVIVGNGKKTGLFKDMYEFKHINNDRMERKKSLNGLRDDSRVKYSFIKDFNVSI